MYKCHQACDVWKVHIYQAPYAEVAESGINERLAGGAAVEEEGAAEELPTSADEVSQANVEFEAGRPFHFCLFTYIPSPHFLRLTCEPRYAHSSYPRVPSYLPLLSSHLKPSLCKQLYTTLKLSYLNKANAVVLKLT